MSDGMIMNPFIFATPDPGGGGFVPTDIAGLQLWFAADEIAGLADADPVTQWDDMSGNARHATQGTASRQPTFRTGILNSLPVVRFDGGDSVQTSSIQVVDADGTWTAFAVAKRSAGTGVGQIVNQDNTSTGDPGTYVRVAQFLRSDSGNLEAIAFNSAGSAFTDGGGAHGSSFFLASAVRSTTDLTAYLNGVSNGPTAVSGTGKVGTTPVSIGSTVTDPAAFFNGDIAEVVLYNSALSGTDRESVEAYLTSKWGL